MFLHTAADVLRHGQNILAGDTEQTAGRTQQSFLGDGVVIGGDIHLAEGVGILQPLNGLIAGNLDPLRGHANPYAPGNEQSGDEIAGGILEPAKRRAIKIVEQFAAVHLTVFFEVVEDGDQCGVGIIDARSMAFLLHQAERVHGGGDGGKVFGLQKPLGEIGIHVFGRVLEAVENIGGNHLHLGLAGGEQLRAARGDGLGFAPENKRSFEERILERGVQIAFEGLGPLALSTDEIGHFLFRRLGAVAQMDFLALIDFLDEVAYLRAVLPGDVDDVLIGRDAGIVDAGSLGDGEFRGRDNFQVELDLGFLVADGDGHGTLHELGLHLHLQSAFNQGGRFRGENFAQTFAENAVGIRRGRLQEGFFAHDLRHGFAHEPERAINLGERQSLFREHFVDDLIHRSRHGAGFQIWVKQRRDVFAADGKTINELQNHDGLGHAEMQGIRIEDFADPIHGFHELPVGPLDVTSQCVVKHIGSGERSDIGVRQ